MFDKNTFWQKLRRNIVFRLGLTGILLLSLILLVDKFVMPFYVGLGDEVELPDIVELPVDEAVSQLNRLGFTTQLTDSVFDANLPKGSVVEQTPYPFTRVKKGRRVYLTVCMGKKPILMPNLFYKSPREAEEILKSYGLALRAKYYEYNDFAVDGVVIGQSYPQGQEIKRDAEITFTISLGPFPVEKTVPDLLGKSLSAARKQLRAIDISKVNVEYEEKENMLPETILKQSIKAGTPITENMEITIIISKLKPEDSQ